MVCLCGFRIEREAELLVPIELEPSFRQRVVAILSARAMTSDVGSVGRDLVGNHALLNVVVVGQPEVLFRCHVAQHGGSMPAGQSRADAAGDVVVTRRDVGD